MSHEEKTKYINKILLSPANQTKDYLSPLLARHAQEKDQAANFNEFMKAIEREQGTFIITIGSAYKR